MTMKNSKHDPGKTPLSSALTSLSRRPMTVFQLRQRLQEKGFSPQEIEDTVNRLIEWKYLDDRSYALAYIRSRGDRLSRKKISIELLRVGIDQDLAVKLLAEFYPEEQEYENCRQLARKLWSEEEIKWERKNQHNLKNRNIPKEILLKKRVGDKLLLRGYLVSTVKSVLTQIALREDF